MNLRSLLVMLLLVFSSFTMAEQAQADALRGFVEVAPQRELYVDYVPAEGGQPTIVLVNGLTYSTHQWDRFTGNLVSKGIGVLRYDCFGQGRTLLKYAPMTESIPVRDQVEDLRVLLEKLNLEGPYNLAGLSYGGGVVAGFAAAYPSLVKNMIMMAPFTRPLENQDSWIKMQITATRQMFPYNNYSDDALYDFFLRQNVYATYPLAEPIVLENPYKLEAIFRLVQGIRKFRPLDVTETIPPRSLHLMIARQDQYINAEVLDEYWDAVPEESRASRLYVNGSEHKMVEAVPKFTAAWVYQIITGNEALFEGRDFEGYPFRGQVISEEGRVEVE